MYPNVVVHVEPQLPFCILVAKFTTVTKRIVKNEVVASLLPQPERIIPSHLTFTYPICPTDDKPCRYYQPRECNNIHPATYKSEATPTTTTEELNLYYVGDQYRERLKKILKKDETM